MAKHCRDLHCGSFAPKDSDWCKRHRVDHPQIISGAVEALRGIEHGYAPGGRLPDPDGKLGDWLGDIKEAQRRQDAQAAAARRLLASGTVAPDGKVERNYAYPDAGRSWDQAGTRAAEAMDTLQSAAAGAKRSRKHRAPKTVRRGWRRMFKKEAP